MADTLRLLHVADVHLGTPFAGRAPELRERLRDAVKGAFGNAVEEALARRVDAVMIAGDLYEATTFSYADERWLTRQLDRVREAGIVMAYCTGNHDPAAARHTQITWPDGMEIFASRDPRTVLLRRGRDPIARLVGAGHQDDSETADLAARFPVATPGPPIVGLLHAQVGGAGGGRHARYAPTDQVTLDSRGYAYWALGHVHERQALATAAPAVYPGNIQGRDPTETGPRGAALVEITPDGLASHRWLDLASLQWTRLEAALDESTRSDDDILQAIADRVTAAVAADRRDRALLRVTLYGRSPAATRLADATLTAQLAKEAAATLGVGHLELIAGDLRPPVEVAAHRGRPDVLGLALELAATAGESDREGGLEGLEEELVERFLRS